MEGKLRVGDAAAWSCLAIIPAFESWRGISMTQAQAVAHIFIRWSTTVAEVHEYGVLKYQLASPGNGARFRIAFAGKETRVYKDWTGSAGELIYSSPKEQTFPYRVFARVEWQETWVTNIVLTTRPFPKTIYGAAQQTEDGFTPGDPIQMDVWQYSLRAGAGQKVRVVL